mgnify:FL=1
MESDQDYAFIYKELGTIYFYKGDFLKSSEYIKKAIAYYEKINDNEGLARCYNNLAIVEMNRNINDALKIYQTTLNYADISGNINIVALVHAKFIFGQVM